MKVIIYKIDNANECIAEIETLNLKEVIKNNFTDFDSMHSELDKGKFNFRLTV